MTEDFFELETVNLKNRAVKGAGFNVASQFLSLIFHTVGVIVLSRLLKPSDFGLVAMVVAFSSWLANFGLNGFTEFIIYKQKLGKEEVTSIFWVHVLIATILACGFVFFGFFLVKIYKEPALSGIAAAMASSFVLYALSTSHIALLKRDMKFASVAIADLVAVILSIIFAIAAALAGMGYWAVVIRQLTIPAVMVAAAWILCPWRPQKPIRLQRARPGLKYAIRIFMNVSLGFIMNGLDKVLLGRYHGSELLGNYDRAYYIFSMPATQLLTPLHNVALATLSRLKGDRQRFTEYYARAVSLVTFPGVFTALALTISARDLVNLILGPTWVEAGRVVSAFGPGIAAMLFYGTSSWLHLSLGTPDRWLRWNLFAAAVTVTAFVIAAPFGAVAMATALTIRTFTIAIPAIWYGGRPIHLNLGTVMKNIWPYFVSGTVVYLFWIFLLGHWSPATDLAMSSGPIARIFLSTGISAVLYLALVVTFQRGFKSIRDILSLIPLVFRRH